LTVSSGKTKEHIHMPHDRPMFLIHNIYKSTLLITTFIFCVLIAPISIAAETSEDGEHRSHHPDIYGEQNEQLSMVPSAEKVNPATAPAGMMGAGGVKGAGGMMAGGMDKMMEKMGAPKPKDLYPSLMALPDLPQEQRDELKDAARKRMSQGSSIMAEGFKGLSSAVERNDFATMQESVGKIKEGLSQYDSGLATERALAEGKAPKSVALQWFKSQMNLLPVSMQSQSTTLFGMSPFHSSLMLVLVLFAIAMIWMYLFKLRRASALLTELATSQPTASDSVSAEPAPAVAEETLSTPVIPVDTEIQAMTALASSVATGKWSGELEVVNQFQETPNVQTFRLAIPGGGPLPFTYQPGQFLTFSLQPEDKIVKRSYTIASPPSQRDYIEVTIKREEQGLISRYLHDQVKVGDKLALQAPGGKFHFNGTEADNVVLISGGVGITPMMSATRYLTDHCWPGNIYFLFCARTSDDFIYRQELEYLQQRHENLHVLASMTRAKGTTWMGSQGQFTPEVINDFVPNIMQHRAHICGPPAMMDAVRDMLLGLGLQKNQIKTEAFGTVKRIPTAQPVIASVPADESVPKVAFSLSQKTADLPPGKTVLEAADDNGIEIDNSCRSGTCGSCMVKLLSGQVSMEVEDALEPEDKANGYILACQAVATKDVVVEA
tara:strand:- start:7685 stop:9673 length:1989 start_codon:yes stop_codon:yes gene_type:complete